MNKMKKSSIIISALFAVCISSAAQGINQSVQVTNDFETVFSDFKKMEPDLALPDSLYRFDYSFDYSVFDSPYRGSYEFSPYNVDVVPEPERIRPSRLYLRAGAGYTLHPVLDIVYTPVAARSAGLSLYNFGRGYAGPEFHDLYDRAGVSGRWSMSGSVLEYGLGYDGIFAGAVSSKSTCYHSGYASLGFRSVNSDPTFLSYQLNLDYRYSSDNLPAAVTRENLFQLDGSVGPVIATNYRFLLDFSFDIAALTDTRPEVASRTANFASFHPHLKFTPGIFDIDAGLVVDYVLDGTSRFYLAPAVTAGVDLFGGSTELKATIHGGPRVRSSQSLKSLNHFYTRVSTAPDVTRTKLDASLSLAGRIGRMLQYSLDGGFAALADAPLDSLGTLGFASYNLAYADARLAWKSERFDADLLFEFRHSIIDPSVSLYPEPKFGVRLDMSYNWLERIYASVFLDAASRRSDPSGVLPEVPSYADLGIGADYRVSRMLSVWGRAGNLLGMEIQRCPGFVERGLYFTLGLSLKI